MIIQISELYMTSKSINLFIIKNKIRNNLIYEWNEIIRNLMLRGNFKFIRNMFMIKISISAKYAVLWP